MSIDDLMRHKIKKLYFADHYSINAICEVTGLHHLTVKRAINYDAFKKSKPKKKKSILDNYQRIIDEQLELYPKLPATRLIQILQDRGYEGSISLLRLHLKQTRHRYLKSYINMKVLPGEQGQVDWAHCGTLQVGKAQRKLYLFVMVLSYSRTIYAKFCLNQNTATFLRCHEDAFKYFKGIPRIILYDNLKSVVLDRLGAKVRFNPQILDFSGFYHFEPRPCNVYRGNEKGRVERTIRYIRDNFLAARVLSDITTMNNSIYDWCNRIGNQRKWPEDRTRTVYQKWMEERLKLLSCPDKIVHPKEQYLKKSGKQAQINFDLNTYSIPSDYVGLNLQLTADDNKVEILFDGKLIATHMRSFDRNQFIEDKQHRKHTTSYKYYGKANHRLRCITADFPEVEVLFERWFQHGHSTSTLTKKVEILREDYGDDILLKALKICAEQDSLTIESLKYLVEKLQEQSSFLNKIKPQLPNNSAIKKLRIKSHSLDHYDEI